MTTDPMGDLINRVMNGHRARHTNTRAPYSKVKEAICVVLRREGYIRDFEKTTVASQGPPRCAVVIEGSQTT